MTADAALGPDDLAIVPDGMIALLLSYLNLPPVGGFADADGPVALGTDAAFELPAALRRSLRDRRERAKGFNALADLVAVAGFGASELRAVLDRVANRRRYGHRIQPVWGGSEGLTELFALLESASRHIHLSTYILGGDVGLRVAKLLTRKQRDGVRVRLLFCANGLVTSGAPSGTGGFSKWSDLRTQVNDHYARGRILAELRGSGVPFLNSAPISRHWRRQAFQQQGIANAKAYERWGRSRGIPDMWLAEQEAIDRACSLAFAHVDHRKMVIIDGMCAFVGGQNIADNYLYSNTLSPEPRVNIERWQWHDNSAILHGGAVQDLNELFAKRWMLSGGDRVELNDAFDAPGSGTTGDAIVSTVASVPGMLRLPAARNVPRVLATLLGADCRPSTEGHNPIRARMMQLPELAEREFIAEHCYPTDAELVERWSMIAANGRRKMAMILPVHYDSRVLGYECRRFYPELLAAGVRLWGYQPAILHAKVACADAWYCVTGSYNLNLRSARSDLELQFFIQSADYGAAVRQRIEDDLEHCREQTPSAVARFRSRRSVPVFDALVRYAFL